MKLVMLGTTGYHPNDIRQTACYALPEIGVVLDAGTGMFRLREHIATPELDIFLSHAHLDHIAGLTFLLGTLFDKNMRRVTVHGTAGKLAAVREHLFHREIFPIPPEFELREIARETKLAGGGVLTHFPLVHPGGAIGFRLDWPDRSMAYVTDTTSGPNASYLERIRGVDLLLHECYFGDDTPAEFAAQTGHSRTTPTAELAKEAGVKQLVLIHLNPLIAEVDPIGLPTARKIFPRTMLGEDKATIEF